MSNTRWLGSFVLAIAGMMPAAAAASQFTVNPTRIELSGRAASTLLTVRNDGDSRIRLQVSAHAWSQSLAGQMELAATDDVVVLPAIVTLLPGDERRLRVAVTAPAGAIEKSYRIFLEELPPGEPQAAHGPSVQMLTRVGIPVFLQPAAQSNRASLTDLGLEHGVFAFQIVNQGTMHFVPDAIRVRGFAANGSTLFDKSTDGWYILAGGARRFELRLGTGECAGVGLIVVDIRVGGTTLTERLTTPAGACAP